MCDSGVTIKTSSSGELGWDTALVGGISQAFEIWGRSSNYKDYGIGWCYWLLSVDGRNTVRG